MSMRNKSLCYLSSSPINELEEEVSMKQGIVTILCSDSEKSKAAASLRRTLSADMSSKKWLAQNGLLSTMKKIASSEELVIPIDSSSSSSSSSSEDEGEYGKSLGQDDVWMSIQSQKERNVIKKPVEIDVWGSILSQKSENSSNFSPPYVHPLVKRSASVLSEQSLEICTESLGSETGSDGFCSDILSDGEEEERQRGVPGSNSLRNLHVVKCKKSQVLTFPPPLSSIVGGDGVSVHIQSHRKNGRLILEAVSVPSRKYFHAHRQDGRLLLTLINGPITQENESDVFEEVFGDMEEVDQVIQEEADDGGGYEEEEAVEETFEVIKEVQFADEQNSRSSLPSGTMNVNKKSSRMMKKIMIEKFKNKTTNSMKPDEEAAAAVEGEEEEEAEELSIPQSLPPPPRVARLIPSPPPPTASFNPYEYFRRQRTAASHGFTNPMITTQQSKSLKNSTKAYEHQDLVLMKVNRTEHIVPYLKGCKESRRSLLIWEPYCIASLPPLDINVM